MRILKSAYFAGWTVDEDLVKFVNENNIKQEDILSINYKTQGAFTLFYFAEK